MKPPTHSRFLFPTAGKSVSGVPLTFMLVDSARSFRWRFPVDPIRSSRNPGCQQGNSGLPARAFELAAVSCQFRQLLTIDYVGVHPLSLIMLRLSYAGSWFVSQGLNQPETGVTFPVGLNPLRLDSPCDLLVKPGLLATCRSPHRAFQGQLFHR